MSEAHSQQTAPKTRKLLWISSLWERVNAREKEERRKEEVLRVFRELTKDSRLAEHVPEYSPPREVRWRPHWWGLRNVKREGAAYASS